MVQEYLKENEDLVLIDTKEETQETVILTDERIIYIKDSKVVYDKKYIRELKDKNSVMGIYKIKFYDKNLSFITDPHKAFCIEFIRPVTGSRTTREACECILSGFPNITEIALQLHIRCSSRAYDKFLSSEAKKLKRNSKIISWAVLFAFIITEIFIFVYAKKLLILSPLLFIIYGIVWVVLNSKPLSKAYNKEWEYRNETYNIHTNINNAQQI